MVDKSSSETGHEQREDGQAPTRKAYQRPVLTKLGGLRDMTMSKFGGGTPDGRPGRGTKRGGNFETCRS